ncbi:MAG: outer membrane protein assembly factor BamE [Desulfobulbaceae bacterium]|nr:outer membrane protein assembly factor BamE [Desulfobulbaceae bacterium]
MKRISVLIWLFAGLVLISCSVPVKFGQPLAMDKIQGISKGLSSQDVETLLGEPLTVGRNKEGQETWSWYYLQADLPAKPGKDPVVQRLTISFDQGQVVSTEYDMSKTGK